MAVGRLLPVLLLGLGLLSCGDDETPPDEVTDPATEEPSEATQDEEAVGSKEPELRLVATVAPVADLAARVGGARVEVVSLVPPGADSHTYEPRPGDVSTLADADAFLGIGLDLNPGALALAEESLDEDRVVRLGETYLDDDALVFDHAHSDDGHAHGDEGHAHGDDGHTHDGGDGPGPNPHVWTGLGQAALLVDGIADALTALDPEGEETYLANAVDAREELEDLDGRILQAVATIPEEHRTLVVYHDAWSYFAQDYGLEMVTAVQPSDFTEPSAGEVRELIDLLRERDVPALFGSEMFPSDVLDAISEETDAVYVADLADDVLPGEPGDDQHSYVGLMRRNAALIVEGLGGDTAALTDG